MKAHPAPHFPTLSDTKHWQVSAGYRGLGDAVRTWFDTTRLAVVSDTVIWARLGSSFLEALDREGLTIDTTELLPGEPVLHAEYEWVQDLVSRLSGVKALLVSLGSGTVNDLVKRAAFEIGVPYLSVASAPSVDGYSSYGAAILVDGFKKTLECTAPRVIFADPAVLAAAPGELLAAGYGDLASKLVAGSDWVLADVFGLDPINPVAWSMVQDDLRERLEAPFEKLPETLFTGLLNTGFAMQYMRSSRPVSGSEHLMAHIWEMENLEKNGRPVLHGNKVALGLLSMTAFTEEAGRIIGSRPYSVLSKSFQAVPGPDARREEIEGISSHLPEAAREELLRIALEKLPSQDTLSARYGRFDRELGSICSRALTRLYPFAELREKLIAAGCPTEPSSLGITREHFRRTLRLSQAMRNRFTIADFAWELGIFDECMEKTLARFDWNNGGK